MATERVVAFGFLTNRDLEWLGSGFTRHFPDRIEIAPADHGIILRTRDDG